MYNNSQMYKRICYDYDLVSGKVNGVDYQPGYSDAFYYRYQYDAENRLTNVLTSRDSITWEQDASYVYYKHGPLSRMVLGQLQTQGVDYTYTLQGWLKGANIGNGYGAAVVDSSGSFCAPGSALSDVVVTSRSITDTPYTYTALNSITFESGFESYDGDSLQTNVNPSLTACNLPSNAGDTASASGLSEAYPIAQDAYSYSLHYYPGDYNAIGATTPVPDVLTTLGSQAYPLYNGNIAASAVILPGGLRPQVYSYQYDQLNRLVQMKVDTGLNAATHTFTPISLPDYGERVAYDPNGNINGYVRHGFGANIPMDSLTYHYYANTNQLQRINDSAGGSDTTDLKDQGSGNNYTYDLNGQLKQDTRDSVSAIDWTVYGKIDTIVNSSGTIVYTYDAAGNRITKSAAGTNTIYVRDAQGNIMAIYTQSGSKAPIQSEIDVYGSSRLGSIGALTVVPTSVTLASGYGSPYLGTFSRGEKSYELTNHLGNVLSTITDKKIAVPSGGSSLIDHFLPDVTMAQDYYPFGMVMPGRTYPGSTASSYRYGFNGKENDNEVKGTGNEIDYGMRYYDPRVGRFMSLDPLQKKYPWFTPYQFAGNSPIANIDLDGKENYYFTFIWDSKSKGFNCIGVSVQKNQSTAWDILLGRDPDEYTGKQIQGQHFSYYYNGHDFSSYKEMMDYQAAHPEKPASSDKPSSREAIATGVVMLGTAISEEAMENTGAGQSMDPTEVATDEAELMTVENSFLQNSFKNEEVTTETTQKVAAANSGKLTIPQGLTEAEFDKISDKIIDKVGSISQDIVVQGSRAAGTAKAEADIDIAVKLKQPEFSKFLAQRFQNVNFGTAKEKTFVHAYQTGKITGGDAGLRGLRIELEQILGKKVQISVIKEGGPFDNGAQIPINPTKK